MSIYTTVAGCDPPCLNVRCVEGLHRRAPQLATVDFGGQAYQRCAAELRSTCEKARGNLQNRELVIDLKNLTAISQQGEDRCLS